jgi:hypothetical protein
MPDPQQATDGLFCDLGNIALLSKAQTRSISAENFTGEKGQGGMATKGLGEGAARDLGRGWKVSPAINIKANTTVTLADIKGPGAIQHMWLTACHWRQSILRIYWDGQEQPSVECPVGDFFVNGWGYYKQVNSLPVNVNPAMGLNCYWPMPFREHCRITLENVGAEDATLYYQVDYALNDVPDGAAYFHAQFRRQNPLAYKDVFTILDGVEGQGHYAGTYLAWQLNNDGWWGEGEIKFYLDGDWRKGQECAERGGEAFPTICGTGTEDYFCGSHDFESQQPSVASSHKGERPKARYAEYSGPYCGVPLVVQPDGFYRANTRFSMYRWHVPDPIRFQNDIQVTIQALGWRSHARYLPLQDDIASVAFWYQTLPTAPFPEIPDADALEII